MVILSSGLFINFGVFLYQCSLSNFTSVSLHMLKCISAHTLSCLCIYCSFANTEHANIMCLLSRQIIDIICICHLLLFVTHLLIIIIIIIIIIITTTSSSSI